MKISIRENPNLGELIFAKLDGRYFSPRADSDGYFSVSQIAQIYPTNQLMYPPIPCVFVGLEGGEHILVQYRTEAERSEELKSLELLRRLNGYFREAIRYKGEVIKE